MSRGLNIAFFGSSLVSAYWNGAATYYRGIVRALARARPSRHVLRARRLRPPAAPRHRRSRLGAAWSSIRATATDGVLRALDAARAAPTWSSRRAASASSTSCSRRPCSTCSGRGRCVVVLGRRRAGDARPRAARSARSVSRADPALRPGPHLRRRRAGGRRLRGARRAATACRSTTRSIPTTHHPVAPDPRFAADLGFLGNRLPDREARVEEFFLARRRARCPSERFLLGGSGWDDKAMPANVRYVGHVYTARPQRVQLHAARGAERQPRQHGALRLLARRRACSRRRARAPA